MGQLNGVFPAVVIDNVDPENLGRIQVQLPQMDESGQRGSNAWARVATLMAGKNRGTWFIPDANDEVLVAFEAGDVRRPYVIGSLWNGTSSPPETMDANNNKKTSAFPQRRDDHPRRSKRPGALHCRDAWWPKGHAQGRPWLDRNYG